MPLDEVGIGMYVLRQLNKVYKIQSYHHQHKKKEEEEEEEKKKKKSRRLVRTGVRPAIQTGNQCIWPNLVPPHPLVSKENEEDPGCLF